MVMSRGLGDVYKRQPQNVHLMNDTKRESKEQFPTLKTDTKTDQRKDKKLRRRKRKREWKKQMNVFTKEPSNQNNKNFFIFWGVKIVVKGESEKHVSVKSTWEWKARAVRRALVRFDQKKLKDPKLAEVFQIKIGGRFATICILDSDVDTLANSPNEVLLSTAEETLGKQRKNS